MNLYKHTFQHWAQIDSELGIKGYFFARNDREAYDIVYQSGFCITVNRVHNRETTTDLKDKSKKIYNIDGISYRDSLTEEEAIQIVVNKRGELNFEDIHTLNCREDFYYDNLRLDGWELIKEDLSLTDLISLRRLGIVESDNFDEYIFSQHF